MASVNASTTIVRSIDLDLGSGRGVLRVSVSLGEDGEPEALILAPGFGRGPEFTRPAWHGPPLNLPASVVPPLQEALTELVRG